MKAYPLAPTVNTPPPPFRMVADIERELREVRERLMRYTEGSRQWRTLTLRHKALALELALTTGALSLGVL